MNKIEVSARMTIRPGKLEGFKRQALEIIKQTREKDSKTLRYEWYLNSDNTACEVREAYVSSEGLFEHRMHVGEAINALFDEFADDHAVTIYGAPSPELKAMVQAHKEVRSTWCSRLGGLES
jgi:quinol monooxygenase YgiN